MKKWIVLSAALLTLVFLAACAPTAQHSYKSVKCPACGYQFEMPKSPGN